MPSPVRDERKYVIELAPLSTKGLRPYPRDSLANLIIAVPLIFTYWGGVGALIGLLMRAALRRLLKPERTEPGPSRRVNEG